VHGLNWCFQDQLQALSPLNGGLFVCLDESAGMDMCLAFD
jgi:hypothetical protein